MKRGWPAVCQAVKSREDVFVKADIYSQYMFTQMSNTPGLKLKLVFSPHRPELTLTALFIKRQLYRKQNFILFFYILLFM